MVPSAPEDNELTVMANADPRTYRADEVVSFRKTGEEFGGLSNMAPGFPIRISGVLVRTSEACIKRADFHICPKCKSSSWVRQAR